MFFMVPFRAELELINLLVLVPYNIRLAKALSTHRRKDKHPFRLEIYFLPGSVERSDGIISYPQYRSIIYIERCIEERG